MWSVIRSRNATAFVWAGDAVYADDRIEGTFPTRKKHLGADPEYLRQLLDLQRNQPGYKALLESNINIFGTVDDHDIGIDNADKSFEWAKENGVEYVNFLGLDPESAMARRAYRGLGVYGVQVYDFSRSHDQRLLTDLEAGLDPDVVPVASTRQEQNQDNRKVAVFVLDGRTNKEPWPTSLTERFSNSNKGDFLGEEQFRWFETAIARSSAAVNIVVTGLTVHGDKYYDGNTIEAWSRFPYAQNRLYQALLQPNVQAPILVTGDIHMSQMARKDCRQISNKEEIRPIYEVTTSGMTHSWGFGTTNAVCGTKQDMPLCNIYFLNNIYGLVFKFLHEMSPWTELMVDETTNKLQYNLDLNIAEIEFDWDRRMVLTSILGEHGQILLHSNRTMEEITFATSTMVKREEFDIIEERHHDMEMVDGQNDWVCVHHRGIPPKYHYTLAVASTGCLLLSIILFPIAVFIHLGRKLYTKRGR